MAFSPARFVRLLLALALVTAAAPGAAAPSYVHPDYFTRTLGVTDGLPVNATTALATDASGYLWVATWDGLARYDGLRVERLRSDTHATLESNRVKDLARDGEGMIWLFFEDGRLGRVRNGVLAPLAASTQAAMGIVVARHVDARG